MCAHIVIRVYSNSLLLLQEAMKLFWWCAAQTVLAIIPEQVTGSAVTAVTNGFTVCVQVSELMMLQTLNLFAIAVMEFSFLLARQGETSVYYVWLLTMNVCLWCDYDCVVYKLNRYRCLTFDLSVIDNMQQLSLYYPANLLFAICWCKSRRLCLLD